MKYGDKLYIITRRDLSKGAQAVQSIHAMSEFYHKYSETENEWFVHSNFLALLTVGDEDELYNLMFKAQEQGIKCAGFVEPDMEDQLTAIALEPGIKTKKICSGFPLMR